MLDHAGDALVVLTGFWRFVFSRAYRHGKIGEWRMASTSVGGRLAIAAEILVGTLVGLGLPGMLAFLLAAALGVF